MTVEEASRNQELSRRRLLVAAGMGAGALVAASYSATGAAQAATVPGKVPDPAATPAVAGLHLQFGADASSEVTVSWHTLQPVTIRGSCSAVPMASSSERWTPTRPATPTGNRSRSSTPTTRRSASFRPTPSTCMARCTMARRRSLARSARRRGAARRSPSPASAIRAHRPPARSSSRQPGVKLPVPVFVNDNLGSPAGGDTTLGVERLRPLFHLFNGDLCYANLAEDRVRTWWDFWANNTRSARNRPWMPSPGNHENELGNGPIGYQAYQTYFSVPDAAGQTDVTRGLWYAFTAGSVRVISIANDDVTLPGRRQLLCAGLFVRSAESLAGKGTGRHSGRS